MECFTQWQPYDLLVFFQSRKPKNMDFLVDLELACSVEDSLFNEIVSIYADTENTPVERAIKLSHIASQSEKDDIEAVIRLLCFVTDTVIESRNYDDSLKELTKTVSDLSSKNDKASLGWKKITDRICDLEDYFILKKIDNIKNRYSNINEFQITTDIRPIFDMKRESINTEIYPYILKINTTDDKTFICEFYDDTIDKLIEELENAKKKVKAIKDFHEN